MIKDGVMICCEECSSYTCGCPEAKEIESLRQQLASRDAEVAELMALLSRASISIGSFIEGNDWAQSDMDTMDSIDALIYRKALAATETTK